LEQEMKRHEMTNQAMARELQTSRLQIDRRLDPRNTAITLETTTHGAKVFGKRVLIRIATGSRSK
jgi:hypothetical protein